MAWFREKRAALAMAVVVAIGAALRMYVATLGHNFDLDSYNIVADIVGRGENVYSSTWRYNYGPVWLHVVFGLKALGTVISSEPKEALGYLLSVLLTVTDIAIFFVLWKKAGKLAACLFFLNPISIIISGYHRQFDNIALLLGLAAVSVIGDRTDGRPNLRTFAGLAILGVSLMTKHILFAFPVWLAVKQKTWLRRVIFLAIPTLIFLLAFVPYWEYGQTGIIDNVFRYRSHQLEILFRLSVPEMLRPFIDPRVYWLALLALFGLVFRARDVLSSLMLYTCILVAASPSTANQYLPIVVPFIAINMNLFYALYTVAGAWFLVGTVLGVSELRDALPLDGNSWLTIAIALLSLGFAWQMLGRPTLAMLRRMRTRDARDTIALAPPDHPSPISDVAGVFPDGHTAEVDAGNLIGGLDALAPVAPTGRDDQP
ncbi:MAG TPA: hypothetical protein PKY66_07725 [Thermoflexales bacterium]|nr:hypothetical protein [Thermoflexales bacterium]